jgi:hypothetical protein
VSQQHFPRTAKRLLGLLYGSAVGHHTAVAESHRATLDRDGEAQAAPATEQTSHAFTCIGQEAMTIDLDMKKLLSNELSNKNVMTAVTRKSIYQLTPEDKPWLSWSQEA